MIVIKLSGGLGNQMFQYAFAMAFSQDRSIRPYFDISFFQNRHQKTTQRDFELGIFDLDLSYISKKPNQLFNAPLTQAEKVKYFFKKMVGQKPFIYISEKTFEELSVSFDTKFNYYVDGYWQSEKYFMHHGKIIRKDFTFQHALSLQNQQLVNKIQTEESVSIHFRRGDYVSNELFNQRHGVCDMSYYQKAVDYIAQHVNKPYFYIFSDEPKWVKQHFEIPFPHQIVASNLGEHSYIDMFLMSKCKHNIIANSSFSWWGAWLNDHTSKIIIAPEKWFNDPTRNQEKEDLIPQNWIKM